MNDAVRLDLFTSPGSVFSYFFDDEVMSTICSWINERADVFKQENPDKKLIHGLELRAVRTDELHVFFGLIMVMRVIFQEYVETCLFT